MGYKHHSNTKSTGLMWAPDLPVHWVRRRLRFLLRDGHSGLKIGPFGSQIKLQDLTDYGFKIYGQENVIGRDFRVGYRYLSPESFEELKVYEITQSDVLVTMMGTSGRCEIVPPAICPGIMDSHLVRLRTNEEITGEFLRYLIEESHYVRTQIDLLGKGSIMQGLNSSIIKSLDVLLPPKAEQDEIVDFLDWKTGQIDALIARKRELLEKLKEKRLAVITQAVTKGLNPAAPMHDSGIPWLGQVPQHWEVIPLGFLVTMTGGMTPSMANAEYWEGDIPWVTPKDMKQPKISDSIDRVTNRALEDTSIALIPVNAVLIVVRGMILAHSFPTAITEKPVTINQDMKALRAGEKLEVEYLFWTLTGFAKVFSALAQESAHGTRKMETETIKKFAFPVPPGDEQKAIIRSLEAWLRQLDSLSLATESTIARLTEYRTALITAATTGKIDVRGVKIPEAP